MPDRDEFSRMPRGIRRYAEALRAAAKGQPLQPIVAAKVVDGLFKDGVKHLASILECVTGPGEVEDKLEALDVIRRRTPGNKLDLLAHRAAERAVLRGEFGPGTLVRDLVGVSVDHLIAEAKDGALEANNDPAAAGRIRSSLAEQVDRAQEKFLKNPSIKRLGLAKDLKHPVDLSEALPFQGGSDV